MPDRTAVAFHPWPWPAAMLGRTLLALLHDGAEARLRAPAEGRVLLTDSGRSALLCALRSAGAGPGRVVALSTFTCPAVVDAVTSAGATPVFCDVTPELALSLADLDAAVGEPGIVILTNTYGQREYDTLGAALRDRGHTVIDDVAAAGLRVVPGPFATVCSFGPGKPVNAFGGGAVVGGPGTPVALGAPEPAGETLRATVLPLTADVLHRRGWRRTGYADDKVSSLLGEPERITPRAMSRLQRAALAARLADVERRLAARREYVTRLAALLSGRVRSGAVRTSDTDLWLVFEAPGVRYGFTRALADHGVQTAWNYYPLHLLPQYAQWAGRPLPVAEDLWRRVLSLPVQPQRGRPAERLAAAVLAADRTT